MLERCSAAAGLCRRVLWIESTSIFDQEDGGLVVLVWVIVSIIMI
jgi:hypothetical protein